MSVCYVNVPTSVRLIMRTMILSHQNIRLPDLSYLELESLRIHSPLFFSDSHKLPQLRNLQFNDYSLDLRAFRSIIGKVRQVQLPKLLALTILYPANEEYEEENDSLQVFAKSISQGDFSIFQGDFSITLEPRQDFSIIVEDVYRQEMNKNDLKVEDKYCQKMDEEMEPLKLMSYDGEDEEMEDEEIEDEEMEDKYWHEDEPEEMIPPSAMYSLLVRNAGVRSRGAKTP